jgi:hypothetical protein
MIKEFYDSGVIKAIVYDDMTIRAFDESGEETDCQVDVRYIEALNKTEIRVLGPEMFHDFGRGLISDPMRQVVMQIFLEGKV